LTTELFLKLYGQTTHDPTQESRA